MSALEPTRTTLAALAALDPSTGPVEMINLLRFHARADYPEGSPHAECSGRAAYLRYGAAVQGHLARAGAEVVRHAEVLSAFIAPADERWDEVLVVRYPSIGAFLRMIADPGYQQLTIHRRAALADSRLLVTRLQR